ncbi:MAG: hypothetical protein SGBAC_003222 [Bacillariaceae sp.]
MTGHNLLIMSGIGRDHKKGESILHHLARLGSKVTDPIKRRRRKRVVKKRLDEIRAFMNEASSRTGSTTLPQPTANIAPEKQGDYLVDELSSVSDGEYCDDSIVKLIDQNDLLVECFMGNDDGDTTFVVHFFSEACLISEEIDDYLETRFFDKTSSDWQCRQVNARLSPLISKILDIDPEQPTVVAVKDGTLVTKQTEFSSPVTAQLDRWMSATKIMVSAQQSLIESIDDFSDDDYSSDSSDEDNEIDL